MAEGLPINRTFRSAAAHCAGRVVGALLTGMLDDGVAGLVAIARCGGLTIVQDPADASFPDLPRNALAILDPHHVVAVRDIGRLLTRAVNDPAPPADVPASVALEASLDADAPPAGAPPIAASNELGPQTAYTCPECGGPLWRTLGAPQHYRCYLGHTASARALLERKDAEVERSLWAAVRSLEERVALLSGLAEDSRRAGRDLSAVEFERRAREAGDHSSRAREFLLALQRAGVGSG